jgi:hypothetical protein
VKKVVKAFLVLFLVSLCSLSYSQFVRIANRAIIAGYVFDEENSDPLSYVNVYVKKTRKGTITDATGYFLLSAHVGDTLTFSSLGYHNKYVAIDDTISNYEEKPLIVFLDAKVFELKSVDVVALRKYEQFKYDFTNLELPDDDYVYAQNNFPFKPKDIDYYSRVGNPGFGLVVSPITALYNKFSKEGKEKAKLEELQNQMLLEEVIDAKINPELIMKITGLSHTETNVFLKWCNLSPEFIMRMSEYELISLISHRYLEYASIKKRNNKF